MSISPPPESRPLLIFDGDCGFCRRCVARLQLETGDRIQYEPFQSAGARFSDIPGEEFQKSVFLIEPDGRTTRAAEAIARTLKLGADRTIPLWLYEHLPGAGATAEAAYRLVARHRGLFSRMLNLLWGPHIGPASYFRTRRLFLQCLAVIFLIAFLSLRVQILGLIGEQGILPVGEYLKNLEQYAQRTSGGPAWTRWPTLVWLNPGDRFLTLLCDVGAVTSMLALFGILSGPSFVVLWILYLSLYHAGQTFLSFQWDLLLLETGFLAVFFAPWRFLSRLRHDPPPSKIVLWLLRLLLFKLMFLSGIVKLVDDHPVERTWHKLEALHYHYETQCIPNALAWYAHQLPGWFQKFSTLSMFVIELAVPFLIFLPRRPRLLAFILLVFLQLLILATGNYNFFNLLTITLCVPLLDDAYLSRILPRRICGVFPPRDALRRPRRLRAATHAALAVVVLTVSGIWFAQVAVRAGNKSHAEHPMSLPNWTDEIVRFGYRFQSINSYGLFRHMTLTRPEVVLEGSRDGVTWHEYEFKYKPGDVMRRPPQVAPHQPRLDWQMWFAALSSPRHQPWIIPLMKRLLESSPPVLALLDKNPFPDAPPRFVRARLYQYRFTDAQTRRETGAWWTRSFNREYTPAVSLDSFQHRNP